VFCIAKGGEMPFFFLERARVFSVPAVAGILVARVYGFRSSEVDVEKERK